MSKPEEVKGKSRRWAVYALTQVLSHQRMLDEVLSEVPEEHRSWVHENVAGVLRFKGRLDWIIDELSIKKKPSGGVRKALLLGAYQLLNQPQVPQAWIVSESVDFVREKEGEIASKFVNAILRKISDHLDSWRAVPWPEGATESEQAQWASIPEWIWRRIVRDHGRDWAKAFAMACLERPSFWIRSRAPIDGASAGPLEGSWKLEAWRPVHESAEYRSGQLFVQDISSQFLIHEFTAEARRYWGHIEGRSVLDLCAAPGGKSAGLAWNGWRVVSTDKQSGTLNSQERFRMLQESAARINSGLTPQSAGMVQVIPREEVGALAELDAVWVDAPCTGSGLLRRHPEVRWIKDEKTLHSLQREQAAILSEAASKVLPGGFLMLTVCSVLKSDEAEHVLRLAKLEGFERVRDWSLSPHLPPHGDGFTAVLLRRR